VPEAFHQRAPRWLGRDETVGHGRARLRLQVAIEEIRRPQMQREVHLAELHLRIVAHAARKFRAAFIF